MTRRSTLRPSGWPPLANVTVPRIAPSRDVPRLTSSWSWHRDGSSSDMPGYCSGLCLCTIGVSVRPGFHGGSHFSPKHTGTFSLVGCRTDCGRVVKQIDQVQRKQKAILSKETVTPEGIEPPTFRSGVERAAIAPRSQLVARLE